MSERTLRKVYDPVCVRLLRRSRRLPELAEASIACDHGN